MIKFQINNNDEGQKIFAFIKKTFKSTSLSIIYKWFRIGKIKVNGKKIKDRNFILKFGDEVIVYDNSSVSTKREWIKCDYSSLRIVYEDNNILIADKNFNVEIHSDFNISLDNMVRSYLYDKKEFIPEDENSFLISHVHRLDKLTSGLVIYAKNKKTLDFFLLAIKNKENITKKYIAKLSSDLTEEGLIKGYIFYDNETQKSIFTDDYKKGFKECSLKIKKLNNDLAEITLFTGRKHQIRATLEFLNCPILNDFRYNGRKINSERMIFLNANSLEFNNFSGDFEYLNGKKIVSSLINIRKW